MKRIPWNKGLSKHTDIRVAAYAKACSDKTKVKASCCATIGCGNKRGGKNLLCRPCRNGIRAYGMTTVDRQTMLDSQNGCCKLCLREIKFDGARPPSKISAMVDHCHGSGKVRAILCVRCNSMLSVIEDYSIELDRIKEYLCR